MARYQATVQSQRPSTETFDYLATFSNAVDWDPGVLAGEQLDPGRSPSAPASASWSPSSGCGCR